MDEQKSDSKIRHINANDFERQLRKSSTKRRRNRLFSDKDNFDTSTEQEDKTQSNIDNHDSSNHINTATQHENNEEIQNTEDEINNSALENNLHEQQNEPSEEDLSSTAQDDTAIQHNTDDGDVTEDNEDIEKPPPLTPEELREQKRRQRRKRQKTIQYIVITALILIIILFLLYMFTPISRIANVTIKGNHNVSTSEINKQLNANSGERMYTFSNSKAKAKLKDNPLIKNVDIQKHLPNTLSVTIEENQVVGMIKDKDDYIPILEGNTELKNYKGQLTDRGPIIEGFKGDKKQEIVHALAEMSPKIRSMIAEVTYEPQKNKQNRIKLYTKDDMQVIGNIKTIADKMKYYPQMSQSLSRDQSGNLTTDGYIDLSVGASFIPYKNQEAQQSQTEQDVTKNSQQENEAKSELQSVLNKINEQSKKNN
ncbi:MULTISPECIES: cell division protein FtsQ/DivIB [Staphylococcus]|uniref:cell division protein FtsQ/DivIB n=1 Tax=Staphylococcus TaxID=1279 RepID=UPI0008AA3CB7|nr:MULTISPECIES: FtsQ-type POTRA domain-containing protein [Staphylococcus]MCI2815308.1 FtsQ-type POTRA domain-containing protein [Staphylococcus lugdunensis]MDU2320723.1 FtsQ-type POTRA domain-containing protein [Staphylococcus lugdunensis]MDU2404234.1 FtsQ-type POTRA domain-containing protein [Staphylococcus lugdunensis]MDU6092225.1 FtsQ-type POTRA domain-containing protein [Staphylococcus lugdunensis]OHP70710.1 cell division protein FtsQ [Staphylococcus sp. HMSC062D12]